MRFQVITLFPQMIENALAQGIVGQAVGRGEIQVETINPRDFAEDVHKTVDDRPFGGGDGMVMRIDPLVSALHSIAETKKGRVVFLSPQGRRWTDQIAREWAKSSEPFTLICGRYAGVDQRFIDHYVDDEISVGDFVLSGGELGALILIDTLARLQPGVLGNQASSSRDSFARGLLEAPLYTRPREHTLGSVPDTLLSGHHGAIESFQLRLSLVLTALKRPDLIQKDQHKKVQKAAEELLSLPLEELKKLGLTPIVLQELLELR